MRKIFIDVGGFAGDSSMAALDPRFDFDQVYCFEPVRECYERICERLRNGRFKAFNFGLLDRTADLPIYHAGSLGGSVFADGPDTGGHVETCSFVEASVFFAEHIYRGDEVWMKLNCEGAECDILTNLLSTGEATKLTEVLIDFDAAKITSASDKLSRTKALLADARFSYHTPPEVQYEMVTNYGGIRNWLIVTGAIDPKLSSLLKSLYFQTRQALAPESTGYYKVRVLRFLGLRPAPRVPTKPGALRAPLRTERSMN
jgi:FkbM family methyltransferase